MKYVLFSTISFLSIESAMCSSEIQNIDGISAQPSASLCNVETFQKSLEDDILREILTINPKTAPETVECNEAGESSWILILLRCFIFPFIPLDYP